MGPSKPVVLLLTHSGDYFTVDRVAAALSNRGAIPFRLDTDQFPLNIALAAYLQPQGLKHCLTYQDQSIAPEAIQAVWMRKLWQPQLSPDLDPRFRDGCARESRAALQGFLDALADVRWIDPLERITAAENKLRQLRIARQAGLTIPRTLVTNSPEAAREFFQELGGNMVAKLLTPLSYGMTSSSFFVYTSAVKEADLVEAESLRYSPMVFQECIPKQRELRAVFVGGSLFVGALDPSTYATETIDWRQTRPERVCWEKAQLPDDVAQDLTILMAELNLTFGAIDLIQTPTGEYVFLEVNPTGEWGMLERDLSYPIAATIADALLA